MTVELVRRVIWKDAGVFGRQLSLPDIRMLRADAIVVCTNNGAGNVPRKLLLPHQLYDTTFDRLIREHPNVTEFTIYPIYTGNGVTYTREEILAVEPTLQDVLAWWQDGYEGSDPAVDKALQILISAVTPEPDLPKTISEE